MSMGFSGANVSTRQHVNIDTIGQGEGTMTAKERAELHERFRRAVRRILELGAERDVAARALHHVGLVTLEGRK
jgi:hypothetical protein